MPELILDLCGSEGAIFFAVQFREKTYSVMGPSNDNFVLVSAKFRYADWLRAPEFWLPYPVKGIKGEALG